VKGILGGDIVGFNNFLVLLNHPRYFEFYLMRLVDLDNMHDHVRAGGDEPRNKAFIAFVNNPESRKTPRIYYFYKKMNSLRGICQYQGKTDAFCPTSDLT
jgi:hypothetical protein